MTFLVVAVLLVGAATAWLVSQAVRSRLISRAERHRRVRLTREAIADIRELEREAQQQMIEIVLRARR